MKYLALLCSILFLSINLEAQIVNIPDGIFKQFLISNGIDTNGDSEIQVSEAEAVENLIIDDNSISTIEGIRSFKNLTSLDIQSLNLNTVDVSSLMYLKDVKFNVNQSYESIDLSDCIAFEEIEIFDAFNLKLTNCASLKRIMVHIFSELDLSGCDNLTYFELSVYEILDFESLSLPALDTLIIGGVNSSDLRVIDIPNLKYLKVYDAGSLFVRECPKLEEIYAEMGIINTDIANLPGLNKIDVGNIFSEGNVNINSCPNLLSININSADFANTIHINDCSVLEDLSVSGFLDVRNFMLINCSAIEEIDVLFATPAQLCDFTGSSSLKNLSLAGPSKLILDGCYSLESFELQNVSFTESIDFSDCINLQIVDLQNVFNLKTLILQNGSDEMIGLSEPLALTNVCVDPDEYSRTINYLSTFENLDVEVTTSCDFADGGKPFTLSGTSYLDINNDSCKTSDITIPYSKYKLSNDNVDNLNFFTNEEGKYKYKVLEGQQVYGPDLLFGDYIFTTTPDNRIANFPSDGLEVVQDFCFIPNDQEVDVIEVHLIPIGAARPGFDAQYLITYTNTGNVTRGGEIKFTFQDEFIDFVSSIPTLDVQEEGFLSWSFEDLIPFETRKIVFSMNLNNPMETPPLNGGDILDFRAEVGPLGNQTLTVYWSQLNQDVVNSFDPNDKTCLSGSTFDYEQVGDYLKYMIRFENTGSAEAVNIVVKDTLDATKLDVNTLQVINASHEVETELSDNVVKFIFKNINLPFEDATNDGYVTFKIKTLPTVQLGEDIRNKAGIYFDFNFPIITNTTSTVVTNITSVIEAEKNVLSLRITPNPASETIYLEADFPMDRIEIMDASGRLIKGVSFTFNKRDMHLSIDHLKTGIYFINAYSKDGHSTAVKFIKN